MKELLLNPGLVPNKNAKSILNPLPGTTKKTGKRKASSPTFWDASDEEFKILKTKRRARKRGQLSEKDKKVLEKLYTQGAAAYGSVQNLTKASKLSKSKVENFSADTDTHTKYRTPRKKFPRLKVQAYRINEFWSIDVPNMDKIAKFNNGVKYLLVAVDVLSRFSRVGPIKSKTAADTTRASKRMTKTFPEKVWPDKGTEFKGEFKQFCNSKNVELYNTHSETKSAFAERSIRSLKNIIHKHLEKKWSYHYINKFHDFVDIINSRVNRVTGLAPKKVTSKHESHLVSLVSNQSKKPLPRPKFKPGDFVRVSKENLPFKKKFLPRRSLKLSKLLLRILQRTT